MILHINFRNSNHLTKRCRWITDWSSWWIKNNSSRTVQNWQWSRCADFFLVRSIWKKKKIISVIQKNAKPHYETIVTFHKAFPLDENDHIKLMLVCTVNYSCMCVKIRNIAKGTNHNFSCWEILNFTQYFSLLGDDKSICLICGCDNNHYR